MEDLLRPRQLPLEPHAVLEEQGVDLSLRRARRNDDLGVAQRVDVDAQLVRPTRHAHRYADVMARDRDVAHIQTVGFTSDNIPAGETASVGELANHDRRVVTAEAERVRDGDAKAR